MIACERAGSSITSMSRPLRIIFQIISRIILMLSAVVIGLALVPLLLIPNLLLGSLLLLVIFLLLRLGKKMEENGAGDQEEKTCHCRARLGFAFRITMAGMVLSVAVRFLLPAYTESTIIGPLNEELKPLSKSILENPPAQEKDQ